MDREPSRLVKLPHERHLGRDSIVQSEVTLHGPHHGPWYTPRAVMCSVVGTLHLAATKKPKQFEKIAMATLTGP